MAPERMPCWRYLHLARCLYPHHSHHSVTGTVGAAQGQSCPHHDALTVLFFMGTLCQEQATGTQTPNHDENKKKEAEKLQRGCYAHIIPFC